MYPHIPAMSHATPTIDALQQRWRDLMRPLERLLRHEQTTGSRLDELQQVESLLETLPLASDLFSVYQNRVRNARRYVQATEIGAARYELRLLASSLRGWLAAQGLGESHRRLGRPTTGQ